MSDFLKDFLVIISEFIFIYGIHLLLKYLLCRHKHKKNKRGKCYFWDCKDFHTCEFNGSIIKKED